MFSSLIPGDIKKATGLLLIINFTNVIEVLNEVFCPQEKKILVSLQLYIPN